MHSDYVIKQLKAYSKGTAISFLSRNDLLNIKIVLPTLEEQNLIYLNAVNKNFNNERRLLFEKYEEQITLKGTLICKSQKQLDAFEKIGARKQAVTLAFSNGKACDMLIFGISKKRNNFLNTGEFLKQDYDIALKVVQPRLIPGGILI